jgi:hypothetical protein
MWRQTLRIHHRQHFQTCGSCQNEKVNFAESVGSTKSMATELPREIGTYHTNSLRRRAHTRGDKGRTRGATARTSTPRGWSARDGNYSAITSNSAKHFAQITRNSRLLRELLLSVLYECLQGSKHELAGDRGFPHRNRIKQWKLKN